MCRSVIWGWELIHHVNNESSHLLSPSYVLGTILHVQHFDVVWSLSRVRLFCDPMDCSPSGSSVHGISQARTLEWVAIPFSRRVFLTQGLHLGLPHGKEILYQLSHQGSPIYFLLSENILHCLLHLNIVKKSVCSFMGRSGGWILK